MINALYNENRNAIPSWQGYNYQGEVAAYKFLEYLHEQLDEGSSKIEEISMNIEWLEDFIIYNSRRIKKIYQVKKTLTQSCFNEVMQNFIIQFKLLNDIESIWYIAYDDVDSTNLESLSKTDFEDLFQNYITNKIVKEFELLKSNVSLNYWMSNLKLKDSQDNKSLLPNIRGIVRKLMEMYSIDFTGLKQEQCESFITGPIKDFMDKITSSVDDYSKFIKQLVFSKIEIDSIKTESIKIIDSIHNKGYITRNGIMSSEDIYNLLFIYIYEKLMQIKNKKSELFTINYDDIVKIFESHDKVKLFWHKMTYDAKEDMRKELSAHCLCCINKNCDECSINQFLELEFCNLVEHCNLEYSKTNGDSIQRSLRNKLTDEKGLHIIDILKTYKDRIVCNKQNDFLELENVDSNLFISANTSTDDERNRMNIIENFSDHLEVYKEYSKILTKNYNDLIDYEQTKIMKNTEMSENIEPTFMDILSVSFIDKSKI